MQCNIWRDLSGCPGFKNTALIQEPCLHSPYYTFSIYLSKKEGTYDFSHDIGTGTELNFPLQTIIKLENKQYKTLIPEKRETYVNSTINIGSNLQFFVQERDLKQNRAVSLSWGAEIRVLEFVGQRSREEAMQISKNLHGVPLSILLKHMIKRHKCSQKITKKL